MSGRRSRRKSHRHVDRPVILHEAYARPDILRTLRILAQQCAEGQLHLRHGPTIGGYIGSGRIDQAARLLQRHAVGHPVTIHRVDQRRRFSPQGITALGDPQITPVAEQLEIGRGHLGRQRQHHAAQGPLRREQLGPRRPRRVSQRTEERHLPRHLRLDGVFLDDLRLCIIVAFGRYADAERRQEPGARHGDLPIRLLDARVGDGQIAVVRQRLRDQRVERRIAEDMPPLLAARERILPEPAGIQVVVRRLHLRRIEPGIAGRQSGQRDEQKQRASHRFCDFKSRLRSNRPRRAIR